MNKLFPTLRYMLKSFSTVMGIGFLLILGAVALTDLIYQVTARYYAANVAVVPLVAPFEIIAGFISLLIGMLMFMPNFKVALANGVSRKTFYLAGLPGAGIAAMAFSIFNLVVMQVHSLFWPITAISDQLYSPAGLGFRLILQASLYFLCIMTGRFITLAYYRSSVTGKWVISLAPMAIVIILNQDNSRFGGVLGTALWDYLRWSLYYSRASALMLVYAAVLYVLVYLLLRRAPIKD